MDGTTRGRDERHTVLQMFGLELQVSDPRLADLLTMDAARALVTEVHGLVTPESLSRTEAEAAEAAPDVVLAPRLPRDDEDARRRQVFRQEVQALGSQLGFEAGTDGLWRSRQGVTLVTRAIDRQLSFAGASHYVTELSARRAAIGGVEATALFVVESQQSADVFKVAVRQQHLHDVMRTISIENLRAVRDLVAAGQLDHRQAVVLLVPMANIDVGEVLSILRSDAEGPMDR